MDKGLEPEAHGCNVFNSPSVVREQASATLVLDDRATIDTPAGPYEHTLQLTTPDDLLVLGAPSSSEQRAWLAALRAACNM